MSHRVILPDGTRIVKRDVVDDLKDFIKRYEFYDDEVHRLWNDYEELEVEYERLKERIRLLSLELGELTWQEMRRSALLKKMGRKWRANGGRR